MRCRVNEILRCSNKMFAPVLGELADEASHEMATVYTKAPGANGTKSEDNIDMDELMQIDIREQDLAGEAEDPFSSDEVFPDVMDIIKKERQP